jgi:hypothetical protein
MKFIHCADVHLDTPLRGLAHFSGHERKKSLEVYQHLSLESVDNPKIFVRTMSEHGAREASRRLLRGSEIPQGLYTLAEIGRLDLSLEAFIRDNPRFQALFADEPRILANCISRLQLLGYS